MSPNIESIRRSDELQEKTTQYLQFKSNIHQKIMNSEDEYTKRKQRLLDYFNGTEDDWENWHWQMKNRIQDVATLSLFVDLSTTDYNEIARVVKHNRFAIVPYYVAIASRDIHHPVNMLSIPRVAEIVDTTGYDDPMAEEFTNPAGSITRRYPDRLIINVTNICAMYCRHCQRRRLIGESDHHTPVEIINESIEFIRNHPEIRDVLLTGGDALLLSDHQLESILQQLRAIPHVEIIRIGSRTPVTMPMRITPELVQMIKQYHPVYLNTHYNHPYELTTRSMKACEVLANHGIVVGNQAVLLRGINDDPYIMTYLNQRLLQARVRPYYLFHAKSVKGTSHFIPSLSRGLEIMDFMRGFTSGLAIPTYIMNAPGGLGKVPLLPQYIVNKSKNTYTIRTWEDKTFEYADSEY
ncbi:KamA family radical SAM protein [Candidatus Xianfuyuplasma coldseepsis]|uniref:KamA family radical SAM protein n=1 Tax=Candidatus Xianfuyuplasma coldseepsis TaxID=2782163 RepID=A0A7L7KQI8_9MOLU|nr:KamA family radical SAM protein [Xianfuyuplasma coldseepsis]QMS84204.1 KamA family radical SAM protein [Xianfuyuplasma coldseepsis]